MNENEMNENNARPIIWETKGYDLSVCESLHENIEYFLDAQPELLTKENLEQMALKFHEESCYGGPIPFNLTDEVILHEITGNGELPEGFELSDETFNLLAQLNESVRRDLTGFVQPTTKKIPLDDIREALRLYVVGDEK